MLFETIARGLENLFGRWGGPMSFRLLLQPAVAIFFAVRAGIRDAREKNRRFWGALSRIRARRRADTFRRYVRPYHAFMNQKIIPRSATRASVTGVGRPARKYQSLPT